MYFSNSILFWWISVISVNFCCLIVIALKRNFKGHLKISALTFYHKSNYSESHYQHSISNIIGIAKISFISYKIFWEKIEHLFLIQLNILSFLVIQDQYHFDTITHFATIYYPSIQRCPLVFWTNGCLNFWKHLSVSILEKILTWTIFGTFPVKHSCWSPF